MDASRTRSQQFADYLARLPHEERRRIEEAERKFLAKRELRSSTHRRVERDFGAGMMGIDERVPFYLTRR